MEREHRSGWLTPTGSPARTQCSELRSQLSSLCGQPGALTFRPLRDLAHRSPEVVTEMGEDWPVFRQEAPLEPRTLLVLARGHSQKAAFLGVAASLCWQPHDLVHAEGAGSYWLLGGCCRTLWSMTCSSKKFLGRYRGSGEKKITSAQSFNYKP